MNSGDKFHRLQVPLGFKNVYEDLVKNILQEGPPVDDIYEFAARYFEEMLEGRGEHVYSLPSDQRLAKSASGLTDDALLAVDLKEPPDVAEAVPDHVLKSFLTPKAIAVYGSLLKKAVSDSLKSVDTKSHQVKKKSTSTKRKSEGSALSPQPRPKTSEEQPSKTSEDLPSSKTSEDQPSPKTSEDQPSKKTSEDQPSCSSSGSQTEDFKTIAVKIKDRVFDKAAKTVSDRLTGSSDSPTSEKSWGYAVKSVRAQSYLPRCGHIGHDYGTSDEFVTSEDLLTSDSWSSLSSGGSDPVSELTLKPERADAGHQVEVLVCDKCRRASLHRLLDLVGPLTSEEKINLGPGRIHFTDPSSLIADEPIPGPSWGSWVRSWITLRRIRKWEKTGAELEDSSDLKKYSEGDCKPSVKRFCQACDDDDARPDCWNAVRLWYFAMNIRSLSQRVCGRNER